MAYKKAHRKRAAIFVVIAGFILALFIHNRWGYRGNCVLCNALPYHEPCIISLSTGNTIPLTVYDPHPFHMGELAEEQTDGYASLIHYPGFSGYRDTNSRKTVGKIQPSNAAPLRRAFCYSCRKELAEFSPIGFVMADLQGHNDPVFFPLEDGLTLSLRCYEIAVSWDQAENTYYIAVQGVLEQMN